MDDSYLSKDREQINRAKRAYRARNPRIDYYPSKDALAIIKAKYGRSAPCNNNSGILDTIVREWAQDRNLIDKNIKPYGFGNRPELRHPIRARAIDFGTTALRAESLPNPMRRVICGAKTQTGKPCRGKSMQGRRRCKWHGGCSTGPKTSEGKAKALANLRQYRK